MKSRLWIAITCLTILMVLTSTAVANPDEPPSGPKETDTTDVTDLELVPVEQMGGLEGQSPVSMTPAYLINGQPLVSEREPNGSLAQANPITGDTVVILGNIYLQSDEDYFSFTANAGNRIYAATQTSFSASGSTDSTLEVLNSGGGVLEVDLDDGSFGSLSSSIAGVSIPATGTYYLKVRHNSPSGQLRPYYLHFRQQSGLPAAELEPNNAIDNATPLPAAGWIAGSIGQTNDVDFYRLNLNAGDTVFLSLDLDPERDGVTWNGRLGLGLFSSTFLVANDASTTSPNSEAFFMTVKDSGTYYVYIDSLPAGSGDPTFTYHLSASVHPPETPAGSCTTYTQSSAAAIPDAGSITSTLIVPGHPRIADLDVSINLTHANMPDLDLGLQAPTGNHVGLFSDVGANTQPNMDIALDDEAGLPIGLFSILRGMRLQPELAYRLGWFDDQDGGGTWSLTLYDDLAGNTGTLNSWSITICEPPPPAVCPVGSEPLVLYQTDFEANDGGFTHSGVSDEWERGLPVFAPITTCNSGSNCWKTDLDNTYNANSSQDLISPAIGLTDPLLVGPVTLSWAQKYHMESASFDHAYVDVRLTGGGQPTRLWEWLDATMNNTVGPTPVTIQQSGGWGIHTRDLSSYLGQSIEVLYHLDSDSTVNFTGLAVDDVRVAACRIVPAPAIEIEKTVGTDPAVCATTDSVTLPPGGGEVTYCYEVRNTGNVPLTSHTMVDNKLGQILTAFPYSLAPGARAFLLETTTISQTTLNTATWTAVLNGASIPTSASDDDTALVAVTVQTYLPIIVK